MHPSFETMRAAMIDSQLRPNGVNTVRVIEAFEPVERERFVPDRLRALAYLDEDLEVALGRALMEPLVFGNLVMRAELAPTDRVLLVGACTGYEAAVVARLAGHVTALEEDAELAGAARANLAGNANIAVVEGPLAGGWPAAAPYDVLMLNGMVDHIPPALVDQLVDGGRVVGVLRDDDGVGRAIVGRKAGGALGVSAFLDVGVLALPGFARPRGFVF